MKHFSGWIIVALLIVLIALTLRKNRADLQQLTDMTIGQRGPVPVLVATAEYGTIDQELVFSGMLVPRSEVMVISQTQGRVIELHCSLGSRVRAGQILLRVDSDLIGAEFKVTESLYEKALADYESAERLLAGGAITRQQYEGLRLNRDNAEARLMAARKRLDDTGVKAPINGVVNQLFVRQGSTLGPGVPVCEIVNTNDLRLQVRATEQEIALLRTGMSAGVSLEAFPGEVFEGIVTGVSVKANMAHQYVVEIDPGIPDAVEAISGMLAKAVFTIPDTIKAIIIPRKAVLGSLQAPEVYVITDDRAEKRTLELRRSIGNNLKVRGDIAVGDKVVIGGQSNLRDGVMVRIMDEQTR